MCQGHMAAGITAYLDEVEGESFSLKGLEIGGCRQPDRAVRQTDMLSLS